MRVMHHLRSPTVQLGLALGGLMYASYATLHAAYGNIALIGTCIFVAAFAPYYTKLSNKAEEYINRCSAIVSAGRIARFVPQLMFNLGVFWILVAGKVIPAANLAGLGGIVGTAVLTTCASQGMQYVALSLANRDWGDRNRNVMIALSVSVLVTAFATLGFASAKGLFWAFGLSFGALFFAIGAMSDLRARFHPRGGVGVFFGTFNPIHRTHLTLISRAIEERGLKKVYVHCTDVPRLHAQALERGELRIARREQGMRVYEKTERSDVHLNYFPTGNKFYEYEERVQMMRAAIRDAAMQDRVEVLSLPADYARGGFYAVLRRIKALAPNQPLHGIHGSDLGGMWVRGIYDESGWIYPVAVVRKDDVSATAIRAGAKGLTTPSVEQRLSDLKTKPQSPDACVEQSTHTESLPLTIKIVECEAERLKAMTVRAIVYMHEQRCPFREEFDLNDHSCTQVLGLVGEEPVLTARIRYFGSFAKFERLAVRPEHRGKGHGHQLLTFMLKTCRDKGFKVFYLHAQARLTGFYERYGFKAIGREFEFSDHRYVEMQLNERVPLKAPQRLIGSQPMVLNRPENLTTQRGPLERVESVAEAFQ